MGVGETGEGIEQREKKEERLRDTDNSVVIARGEGVGRGRRRERGDQW